LFHLGESRLRPRARQNGGLLHRFSEVGFGHLQMVLRINRLVVSEIPLEDRTLLAAPHPFDLAAL
tara:strand:+ start:327 stop:521 length:195 start_codon:yes stop_codon:yes gene_type:complete